MKLLLLPSWLSALLLEQFGQQGFQLNMERWNGLQELGEYLSAMKAVTLSMFALPLLLSLQTFFSWYWFYKSKFLEYDDNISLMIDVFLLSLSTAVILFVIRSLKKYWIKANKYAIMFWLIIGSPITMILLAIFYINIFGMPNG